MNLWEKRKKAAMQTMAGAVTAGILSGRESPITMAGPRRGASVPRGGVITATSSAAKGTIVILKESAHRAVNAVREAAGTAATAAPGGTGMSAVAARGMVRSRMNEPGRAA